MVSAAGFLNQWNIYVRTLLKQMNSHLRHSKLDRWLSIVMFPGLMALFNFILKFDEIKTPTTKKDARMLTYD